MNFSLHPQLTKKNILQLIKEVVLNVLKLRFLPVERVKRKRRMLNSHLWGGLFWHVHPPHLGFPRGGLLQKTRQPLASPGFQELHSLLPWLSLPPHWIQLPANTHTHPIDTRYKVDLCLTHCNNLELLELTSLFSVLNKLRLKIRLDDTIPNKRLKKAQMWVFINYYISVYISGCLSDRLVPKNQG